MRLPVAIQPLIGRENSFTFLRLLFALLVIVGHAFVLGGFGEEPLALWTRRHLAGRELAVQGFFVLSGFLIAKSLADDSSLWRFACHRFFRIMPAFWVYLLVMVFLVAPWWMEAHAPGQFSYGQKLTQGPASPWHYFEENWALQTHEFEIVPLFDGNPVKHTVNGSLWSIKVEASFYLLAAGAVLARRLARRFALLLGILILAVPFVMSLILGFFIPATAGDAALTAPLAFGSSAAAFLAAACLWRAFVRPGWGLFALFALWYGIVNLDAMNPGWLSSLPLGLGSLVAGPRYWNTSGLAFLGGMLLWRLRAHLRWDWRLLALATGLLVAGARLGAWMAVMPLALPYALLYLAARLPFRGLERVGDFSYGVYIFSFPIQQLLIGWGVHRAGVWALIGASIGVCLPVGALSWYLIEKPALRLGRRLGAWRFRPPAKMEAATALPVS